MSRSSNAEATPDRPVEVMSVMFTCADASNLSFKLEIRKTCENQLILKIIVVYTWRLVVSGLLHEAIEIVVELRRACATQRLFELLSLLLTSTHLANVMTMHPNRSLKEKCCLQKSKR